MMDGSLNGQQQAILLRMKQESLSKWWKRSDFKGTAKMRGDLDDLVVTGHLVTIERPQELPAANGRPKRTVQVTYYQLSPSEISATMPF